MRAFDSIAECFLGGCSRLETILREAFLVYLLKLNTIQVVKKMKKLWPILATLLCLSGGLSQAKGCSTLTMTGPPAGAPSSWVSEGKLIGAAVDLIEGIAFKAGVKKVEVRVFSSWSEALNATYTGEVDLIFSAGWSEERARYLDFVRPSFASQFLYVLVRRGEAFRFQKFEDLLNRTGAATQGEAYGDGAFGQFVSRDLKLQRSPNLNLVFDLLIDGKVDFIFAYENAAYGQLFSRNLSTKVQVLPTYPYRAETFIAFSKRSKCDYELRKRFAEQITLANQANTYTNLTKRYREVFNESMTRPQK